MSGTLRLDKALVARHPELSRRRARQVIERGQVLVDGNAVLEAGHPVSASASIDWNPHRPARRRARCSLPLLYEGPRCVVVDKPAGLLSVPAHETRPSEDTALARVAEYAYHRDRRLRVGAVHRLDRDTSGALAFALDASARVALRGLFRAHAVERVYFALVAGLPERASGRIERPVSLEYASGRRHLARGDEPSLPAVTEWRLLEPLREAALLELRLETGRQHQIRLHLRALGHPVLGDRVYNDAGSGGFARQMLHASSLTLAAPDSGEPISVTSPLPDDFRSALESLRGGPRTVGRRIIRS